MVALVARQMVKETEIGREEVWNRWLSAPLPARPTYSYVNERRQIFEAVRNVLPPTSVVTFDQWMSGQLDDLLQAVTWYNVEDAESPVELIPFVTSKTYFGTVLSFLAKNPRQPGISRLLHLLGTKMGGDVVGCENVVKPSYQRLLQSSLPSLRLSTDKFMKTSQKKIYFGESVRPEEEFFGILDHCRTLGLEVEAQGVLSKCLPELPVPGSPLGHIGGPFTYSSANWSIVFRDSNLDKSAKPPHPLSSRLCNFCNIYRLHSPKGAT